MIFLRELGVCITEMKHLFAEHGNTIESTFTLVQQNSVVFGQHRTRRTLVFQLTLEFCHLFLQHRDLALRPTRAIEFHDSHRVEGCDPSEEDNRVARSGEHSIRR